MQVSKINTNSPVSSMAHIKPVPSIGIILGVGMANKASAAMIVAEAKNYGYDITEEYVMSNCNNTEGWAP